MTLGCPPKLYGSTRIYYDYPIRLKEKRAHTHQKVNFFFFLRGKGLKIQLTDIRLKGTDSIEVLVASCCDIGNTLTSTKRDGKLRQLSNYQVRNDGVN